MTTVVTDVLTSAVEAGAGLADDDAVLLAASGRVVADTLAVAYAGARTTEHAALVERVAGPAGDPAQGETRSTVVGDPPRTAAPQLAAFLNATAAVALELDESLPGGGHPGAHVVPAAVAEAQRLGADGQALLHAVARGYETAGRLHRVRRFPLPAHPHGAIGAIGAAVAVASLRGTDPYGAARAAATLPVLPTWAACFEGASARNAWVGLGAMVGVLASDLAESGLEGVATDPLEAICQVSEPVTPEADDGPLILRSAARPHAVVGPIQSAVEAAAEIHPRLGGAAPDDVLVEAPAVYAKFDRLPVSNDLSARFSLPHAVAAALAGRADYGFDSALLPLAHRVRLDVSNELEGTAAARVVVTAGGQSIAARCDVPLGHPDRPLGEAQRAARIAELVGDDAVAATLLGVGTLADVKELLR